MRPILHIGLHKTGTTGLQSNLLLGKSGYIGKTHNTDDKASYEVKELSDLATYFHQLPPELVTRRLGRWLDRIEAIQSTLDPSVAVKISEERISNWPMTTVETRWPVYYGAMAGKRVGISTPVMPFASLLRSQLAPLAEKRGIGIGVVLTLRNQAEWLGSFYAQASNRILFAGQRNFELQVARMIETADPRLDFHAIVASLDAVLGRDNVRVLLQEDMEAPDFWQSAVAAFELGDARLSEAVFSRANAKGVDADRWKLSKPRGRFARLLRRGGEIRLTDALRDKVRTACQSSNLRLGDWLGRDLGPLGY